VAVARRTHCSPRLRSTYSVIQAYGTLEYGTWPYSWICTDAGVRFCWQFETLPRKTSDLGQL
jgi:hypothetical protein